jgi:hypothetical protein
MREGSIVETDVVSLIETRRYEPAIQWTGFEHPYLLVGYAPRIAEGERVEKHTSATNDGQPHGFMWTYLQFSQTTFKHGDAAMTREVVAYLGPKNYDDLEQADAAAGFSTGFRRPTATIRRSSCPAHHANTMWASSRIPPHQIQTMPVLWPVRSSNDRYP